MDAEIKDGEVYVDARLVGELLGIEPAQVQPLMKRRDITSLCEKGVDADEGAYRLSFFYLNRRARLIVDVQGRVLRRSSVDFGDRPLPDALRKSGGD